MSRNRGFTLIELLVALAIFAIMSGFAFRALTGMLDSREALAKESRKWRDVALFVGRVERDVAAVLPRSANKAVGTPLAPMSSAVDANPGTPGLAVSRSGNMLAGNAAAAPRPQGGRDAARPDVLRRRRQPRHARPRGLALGQHARGQRRGRAPAHRLPTARGPRRAPRLDQHRQRAPRRACRNLDPRGR